MNFTCSVAALFITSLGVWPVVARSVPFPVHLSCDLKLAFRCEHRRTKDKKYRLTSNAIDVHIR